MSLEDLDFGAVSDYAIDDKYHQFEKDLVEAIGLNGKFKKIEIHIKKDLAGRIYAGIDFVIMPAQDRERLHKEKTILLEKAKNVQSLIEDLLLHQRKTRVNFKSETSLLPFLLEDGPKMPLNISWWRLKRYIVGLKQVQTLPPKRGRSNSVDLDVAIFIAEAYQDIVSKIRQENPLFAPTPEIEISLFEKSF